jgi:hypothetical protein
MRKKDLTGLKFGKLTVIKELDERKNGRIVWQCQCECGNICDVIAGNLITNHTLSCGCMKEIDLSGKRFGMLTVIKKAEVSGKRGNKKLQMWECRCDCGRTVMRYTYTLNGDEIKACSECASNIALKVARERGGYVEGVQISRIISNRTPITNSSGVKGVYLDKRTNKWRARLKFKGKLMNFGTYDRFEDAVRARKEAENLVFGEFLDTIKDK